jgi:hypothetical protein
MSRILTTEERAKLFNAGAGLSYDLIASWDFGDPKVEATVNAFGLVFDPVGNNYLRAPDPVLSMDEESVNAIDSNVTPPGRWCTIVAHYEPVPDEPIIV